MEPPKREEKERDLTALLIILMNTPGMKRVPVEDAFPHNRIRNDISEAMGESFRGVYREGYRTLMDQFSILDYDTARIDMTAATEAERWAEGLTRRLYSRVLNRRAAELDGEILRDFYTESDASREAVTSTTEIWSRSEIMAGGDINRRHNKRVSAWWEIEPGACPICTPLAGTGVETWGVAFPNGPPAHPNCRCWLNWREVFYEFPTGTL
ncbi:hypothetical protein [Rosistilla oblonga]|uniref:hypothetical protein n=1 Tax=Rosistilla oblonga TaxID=2527990 RepID=UPI003A96F117